MSNGKEEKSIIRDLLKNNKRELEVQEKKTEDKKLFETKDDEACCDEIFEIVNSETPLYEYICSINQEAYDEELFKKGIKNVSELCGSIVALYNVGINPHKALEYLLETNVAKDTLKNNIELGKINADANIQISKMESANAQKNII